MIRMLARFCACLALLTGGRALAQENTQIVVHVDKTIQRSRLTIQFPGNAPVELGAPITRDAIYNNYQYVVHWPIGGRNRRSDFELFAKIRNGRSSTFYLRLRPNVTPVEIYVFDKQFPECQWLNLATAEAPDDIFEQLATAEAMLTITSPDGRCSADYLQRWTGVWLGLIDRLWRRNQFVRLNPNVIAAIRDAYNMPRPTFLGLFPKPLPLPPQFQRVVNLDNMLSAKFN
jgi:hypothetical protein